MIKDILILVIKETQQKTTICMTKNNINTRVRCKDARKSKPTPVCDSEYFAFAT